MTRYTPFLLLLAFGLILFPKTLHSQSWSLLPNSPTSGFRHDGMSFINADTGWVVNVDGYIYKTTDGGDSFTQLLFQPETSFRCVGFADANRGWAGNLGPGAFSPGNDTIPLYETNDGGVSWQPVTNISGPIPKGLCGMRVVNDSVVYAVGRVGGPCHILKTSDGGASWTSIPPPPNAFFLIDCHFFSSDTGLVVGSSGTVWADERYAIYYTTDGGANWQQVAQTSTFNGHGWKIDFPSSNVGYVSIETQSSDSIPVLKTTDGGLTWEEKLWHIPIWYQQGIGFVNDSTGWCGALANTVKKTTDGGDSWAVVPFVNHFNRFRWVNDSVAYASGNRIWKYSKGPATGLENSNGQQEIPKGLALGPNFPNPFQTETTIPYSIPHPGWVTLKVYDMVGRPVATLVDEFQESGDYKAECSVPYLYDAHFFFTLSFSEGESNQGAQRSDNTFHLTTKGVQVRTRGW